MAAAMKPKMVLVLQPFAAASTCWYSEKLKTTQILWALRQLCSTGKK
jgi:hypothetical protein